MSKAGFVYLLANKHNGTLYTGVTSTLKHRVYLHKTGSFPGFTNRHQLKTLEK